MVIAECRGVKRRVPRLVGWWAVLALSLLAGAYRAAGQNRAPAEAPRYRIIGYVSGRTEIHRVGAEKLTHINYAFARVSDGGEIVLRNQNSPAHLAQLQALKAKNPNLKVIVSVGGWGADNFSDAALTDASREKFAGSVVDLIKKYALDGIDLDWEYPGQPGPGIKYRPEDKQNFTLLLKAVRQRLDALSSERGRTGDGRYTLSIASADREYFAHTEMDQLHVYLDWINVMTYDFFGSLAKTTGHHTGLYRAPGSGESARSTEGSVKQHLNAGIPPEKLVVGVAFYGRGWAGVNPEHGGIGQPYERYTEEYPYSRLARDYIDKSGFQRRWDDAAKAPYLWNPESRTFISYDDPASLKEKADFVKAHRLGGMMYWEHSHDPEEALLNTIFKHLR